MKTRDGTSFAAPQVSGLAALLMQRNGDIKNYPPALKAILMATAVHNIEGDSRLSDRDGAGAISPFLADEVVQKRGDTNDACTEPCWWGIEEWPQTRVLKFTATKGERIRAAIGWWSRADGEPYFSYDYLATNYDLYINAPSGSQTSAMRSQSDDNNYEIVEFFAPETGEYTLAALKESSSESYDNNQLGIAWTKLSTFLPDVRSGNGWQSVIYARNDGAQPRHIQLSAFSSQGQSSWSHTWASVPQRNRREQSSYWFSGGIGSITLDAKENVSTIVESTSSDSDKVAMAYSGVIPESGFTYLPAVYRHDNIKSLITVKNADGDGGLFTLKYYSEQGVYLGDASDYLDAGTSRIFDTDDCNDAPDAVCSSGAAGWGGSVLIYSIFEAAVVVSTEWYSGAQRTRAGQYTGVTEGRTKLYAPSYFRVCQTLDANGDCADWNIISALRVQNTTGTAATVEVTFTPRDGSPSDCKAWTMPSHTIPAYSSKGYNSGDAEFDNLVTSNSACMGWDGTAEVKSTNGVRLAGIANNVWRMGNRAGTYSLAGVEDGRVSLVFPKQMRSGSSKSAINVGSLSFCVV